MRELDRESLDRQGNKETEIETETQEMRERERERERETCNSEKNKRDRGRLVTERNENYTRHMERDR